MGRANPKPDISRPIKSQTGPVEIKANGAGDAAVGWVNKKDAVLLDDAIPYSRL